MSKGNNSNRSEELTNVGLFSGGASAALGGVGWGYGSYETLRDGAFRTLIEVEHFGGEGLAIAGGIVFLASAIRLGHELWQGHEDRPSHPELPN